MPSRCCSRSTPQSPGQRASEGGRPLAIDEHAFHALYRARLPVYEDAADAHAHDADGVVLAAAGIDVRIGALDLLEELVPGTGPVEIVADANVAGIHGVTAQLALGDRDAALARGSSGEPAKAIAVLERLWRALRIGRDGTIVGLGGGCTTDLAGFAAATYMRGVPWVAVPTTLVGQVDAAIGGKTAVDLPGRQEPRRCVPLAGARRRSTRARSRRCPTAEHRNGMAEVVKTGLLMGEPSGSCRSPSSCAGAPPSRPRVCLADPHDRGPRNQLNLGHTFGHALEAAAGYDAPARAGGGARDGRGAPALGERAPRSLRCRAQLDPQPVRVDREAAWAALARDKKTVGGAPRLVLLERAGEPTWGNELPAADVRAALDGLIAD